MNKKNGVDDRTMLMERLMQLAAVLPNTSRTRDGLTTSFLNELWSSLDHPPMLYVGDEVIYRKADGSFNVSLAWRFN